MVSWVSAEMKQNDFSSIEIKWPHKSTFLCSELISEESGITESRMWACGELLSAIFMFYHAWVGCHLKSSRVFYTHEALHYYARGVQKKKKKKRNLLSIEKVPNHLPSFSFPVKQNANELFWGENFKTLRNAQLLLRASLSSCKNEVSSDLFPVS